MRMAGLTDVRELRDVPDSFLCIVDQTMVVCTMCVFCESTMLSHHFVAILEIMS